MDRPLVVKIILYLLLSIKYAALKELILARTYSLAFRIKLNLRLKLVEL